MCDTYQIIRSIDKSYIKFLEFKNFQILYYQFDNLDLKNYLEKLYNHIIDCFLIIEKAMLRIPQEKEFIQKTIDFEEFRDFDCECIFTNEEMFEKIKFYRDKMKLIEDSVIILIEKFDVMEINEIKIKCEYDFILPANEILNTIYF